jgi:ketosteroid isomerase-like protein
MYNGKLFAYFKVRPYFLGKRMVHMSARDLVQRYYDSLAAKTSDWQQLYADDATFSDAAEILLANGKQAVIESFIPFLKGVTRVRVKRLIVDENVACAIIGYEYLNPKGQKMSQDVAEVWDVGGNKLTRLTIYFDLTAYRSFMRG